MACMMMYFFLDMFGRIVAHNSGSVALSRRGGSRLRPILDLQTRHISKVTVLRNNHAVAEAQGDGGYLNINLLHRAAATAELSREPAIFESRDVVERPKSKMTEMTL